MKYFIPFLLIVITIFTSCVEEFGDVETDFIVDSVYYANSDGLLYVELDATWNNFSLSVYADEISEPAEEIASLRWHGSITLPIESNTYWKVSYNQENPEDYVRSLVIRWTPIE